MRDALLDRYRGCLLGLACGDAVGTTVEFRRRGSFEPLVDMVGGGPFELAAGQWTDDTSMALCLAESLRYRDGFDARDQMSRYCNWWQHGYLSATGMCFDIGNTVRAALARFLESGDPMAGSTSPDTAGNGSLMRLAPVVLFRHPDREAIAHDAAESSRTTHAAPEAVECCVLFAHLLADALDGKSKSALVSANGLPLAQPNVVAIASGAYVDKPRAAIAGTGYCVASLEAALWCFQHNDDFASTVLAAANLGDDADTTAAIAGQIAGAHYGRASIPEPWLEKLSMREDIEAYADAFHARTR
jgi:ADP-ribosyl-[dinitrogen reductase] hydrolase